jgi:membrane protein CcdC involved in cytochrome C biogenesis
MSTKIHHEGRLEAGFLVSLLVISFVLKQMVTINNRKSLDLECESLVTEFFIFALKLPWSYTSLFQFKLNY